MSTYYEQLLNEVYHYEERYKESTEPCIYFRGQSNAEWKLETKLHRQNQAYVSGKDYLDWDEQYSVFENLVYMQYCGKPTRLLSFTADFDVALYFACVDENFKDKDGMVVCICTYRSVEREVSFPDVKLISEMSFLKQEILIADFIAHILQKYPELNQSNDMIIDLGMGIQSWDKGFMVTPSKEELEQLQGKIPGIRNQKTAFWVVANKLRGSHRTKSSGTLSYDIILPELENISSSIAHSDYTKYIVIPKEEKSNLLDILNKKGINKNFLFPDR